MEPRQVEAPDCWAAKMMSKMTIASTEFQVTPGGSTISHSPSNFLNGNLTYNSHCRAGLLGLHGGHKIRGQTKFSMSLQERIWQVMHEFY
jgi:hypothetical protein